jgi:2-polyprenyl-3-methyl-5-hydroxy-6-metoxy-1,4-benzoquinol methylase
MISARKPFIQIEMHTMKSDIKKVEVSCNSCGSSRAEFVTHGVEHEYDNTTDDIFNVVKCCDCGLWYLNPRPDVCELKTIYPDNYYAYHLQEKNVETQNTSSLLYRARKFVYLSRLEQSLALCRKQGELKVLDIGCADGRALNWYRQIRTYQVDTHGVDFDTYAVEQAKAAGHTVYTGRFEEAEIPDSFFDLAVATHVIEHVADPKQFARKAFNVLKPGGIFLCETPNADSFDAKLFKKQHWGGYHFPRHWVFYSPQSIQRLAESVGFELVKISYHPAPAFWNWTFHSLLKAQGPALSKAADYLFPPVDFQKNNLKNLLAVSLFTSFDVAIKAFTGKTSNMSVVLRRPH